MRILFIINDPPYGTERAYNALRHANALVTCPEVELKIFFIADAVQCARRGQHTPNGYYNLERMVAKVGGFGAECGACGSCMDARALTDDVLISVVHRSSMDELRDWTLWADKVLVY